MHDHLSVRIFGENLFLIPSIERYKVNCYIIFVNPISQERGSNLPPFNFICTIHLKISKLDKVVNLIESMVCLTINFSI